MKEAKAFTDRRRSPLSYWGRPWGPRSCLHQRRGCWGKTSSPGHSRALGCLGPPPPPARCSEWWRGLKVSKTGGGQKCKRLDIFQNLLLGLGQHSLFLDKPVKSTGCPYNTNGGEKKYNFVDSCNSSHVPMSAERNLLRIVWRANQAWWKKATLNKDEIIGNAPMLQHWQITNNL